MAMLVVVYLDERQVGEAASVDFVAAAPCWSVLAWRRRSAMASHEHCGRAHLLV
jgi:hypothetical protein